MKITNASLEYMAWTNFHKVANNFQLKSEIISSARCSSKNFHTSLNSRNSDSIPILGYPQTNHCVRRGDNQHKQDGTVQKICDHTFCWIKNQGRKLKPIELVVGESRKPWPALGQYLLMPNNRTPCNWGSFGMTLNKQHEALITKCNTSYFV